MFASAAYDHKLFSAAMEPAVRFAARLPGASFEGC